MVGGELGRTLMMLAMMMRWRICQTVQLRWSTRLISPGDKYCRLVVDRGDDGAGGGGGDGGTYMCLVCFFQVSNASNAFSTTSMRQHVLEAWTALALAAIG
ncbi:hypothetical protein TYRP_001304 [Tyrophagus putrescentiae]|nr:hypothetical protein TYRP_001304 [Tyrophagus putrescentiae]